MAQRAIDQAIVAQNQAGAGRGYDQGGLAAGNNRHNHYSDSYRQNLLWDFGNVKTVYNNPLANIAEGIRILRNNVAAAKTERSTL